MNLADMDKALVCSGPVSNISYDSHIVTRQGLLTANHEKTMKFFSRTKNFFNCLSIFRSNRWPRSDNKLAPNIKRARLTPRKQFDFKDIVYCEIRGIENVVNGLVYL
jgi:hypothetical protein